MKSNFMSFLLAMFAMAITSTAQAEEFRLNPMGIFFGKSKAEVTIYPTQGHGNLLLEKYRMFSGVVAKAKEITITCGPVDFEDAPQENCPRVIEIYQSKFGTKDFRSVTTSSLPTDSGLEELKLTVRGEPKAGLLESIVPCEIGTPLRAVIDGFGGELKVLSRVTQPVYDGAIHKGLAYFNNMLLISRVDSKTCLIEIESLRE